MTAPILVVSGPSGAGKSAVSKLLAEAFDRSVWLQSDALMFSVVSGWVDPWLPEADHQNEVIGGAVAAAALECAVGGYTVLLDGTFFPEGIDGFAPWAARRHVELHYAVLRPDYETCLKRVQQRRPGDPENVDALALLHARYSDLGRREPNVVDCSGDAQQVADRVLDAFRSGRLAISGAAGGR